MVTASSPLLIFIITYLLIAVQPVRFLHLNRPAASLLGAVAMVVLGGLPLAEAYAAIDLDVLVFLLGLMILVGYLEEGAFFEVAAVWLLGRRTSRSARDKARLRRVCPGRRTGYAVDVGLGDRGARRAGILTTSKHRKRSR